jgi:hypothetical protein
MLRVMILFVDDDSMTMCIGIVQHATTESDVYIKTSLIFTLS